MTNLVLKKFLVVFLILIFVFLSGCYDSIEVDEMVYVVSIALDKGINGNLRMTFLLAVPIAVGVGPESGEAEKSTTSITVEAPTIFGGMNIANTILSKRLNFSHAKLIIISSELAEKGVEKYIHAFIRYREFRPHMFLGISKGDAGEFLTEAKTILEVNPAKYFELLMESYQYTGFSVESRLESFYTKMECTCEQSVAALLDISRLKEVKDFESVLSENKTDGEGIIMEGDYSAGQIPVVFSNRINMMGLAVFRGEKMVGELNGRETLLFQIVTGNLKKTIYSLTEPAQTKEAISKVAQAEPGCRDYISLRLSQARRPEITVKMIKGAPRISIHIALEGDILSADGEKEYSMGEGREQLEEAVAEQFEKDILSFMEKTRDTFNSDICATGKVIKKTFFLWNDWIEFDWMEKYQRAEFDIFVKLSIRRSGAIIRQISVKDLKGESN